MRGPRQRTCQGMLLCMADDPTAHLAIWYQATQVQGMRVLSDAPWPVSGLVTKQADAYLFLLALRNVYRAAEYAQHLVPTGTSRHRRITLALAAFDDALPDATNVRNVL